MSSVTWQEALGNPGAEQMRHLRAFMESLQIMTAKPCQQIFVEEMRREGTLETHAQATVGKDYICAYLPGGGQAKFDLTSVWQKDEVAVWYWSPADGEFSDAEAQCVKLQNGCLTVSTPTEGEEQDWIVLLSDAGADMLIGKFLVPVEDAKTEEKRCLSGEI